MDNLMLYGYTRLNVPGQIRYRPDLEMEAAQNVNDLGVVLNRLVEFYDQNGGAKLLDILVDPNLVVVQPYYNCAMDNCARVLGCLDVSVQDFYKVVFQMNGPLFS